MSASVKGLAEGARNGGMKTPLDATYVVERSIHQLVKFLFLSFILALALTRTLPSHASAPEFLLYK